MARRRSRKRKAGPADAARDEASHQTVGDSDRSPEGSLPSASDQLHQEARGRLRSAGLFLLDFFGKAAFSIRQAPVDLACAWRREDEPAWRLLPWLLAAAWLLRLFVGLSSDYFLRADEISQYLEQAHRIVFGYGYIPWEYEIGARTWLVAALPMAVLFICDVLGLGHPDFYIPAVAVFNVTLSMTVPVGVYVMCRRLIDERTARAACLISCFWYEFIVFSSHTLAECYASAAFFAAAALLRNPLGTGRAAAVGFLLGLAIALRVHYALSVAGFGLVLLLLPLRHMERASLIAGGTAALLFWGMVDWLTWGAPWSSAFTYIQEAGSAHAKLNNLVRGKTNYFEHNTRFLFWPSLGLVYVGILWSAWRWRKLQPAVAALLPTLVVYLVINEFLEYSNFYLLLLLAGVCLADLHVCLAALDFRLPRLEVRVRTRLLASVALAALSLAGLVGALPGHKHTLIQRNQYVFAEIPYLQAYRLLSRLPAERVSSVLFDVQDLVTSTGQYYYLHHDVGIYFPWTYQEHRQLVEGRPVARSMSHVITYVPQCFPGFSLIGWAGHLAIMENDDIDGVLPPALPDKVLLFFNVDQELLRYFAHNVEPYRKWLEKCIGLLSRPESR